MPTEQLLQIENLHVETLEKPLLQGINLTIQPGKIYALMGPNGAGKTTLANILAGKQNNTITKGKITFMGKNLLTLSPEQRASKGLFMAFQQPIAIPGVRTINFLKTAINQIRLSKNQPELTAPQLLALVKEKTKTLNIDTQLLYKPLNENLSGGEKKLNELLQMVILDPKLAILDEIDSGLDIDTIRLLGKTLQKTRRPDNALIIITHYPHLFKYITPDVIHILQKGRIVQSSDARLGQTLLEKGYKKMNNKPIEKTTPS